MEGGKGDYSVVVEIHFGTGTWSWVYPSFTVDGENFQVGV